MRQGPERRSRASRLARALVALKAEVDACEAELRALSRFRPIRRRELQVQIEDLRAQERRLLGALGGGGTAGSGSV
jgi:hypothetical protein